MWPVRLSAGHLAPIQDKAGAEYFTRRKTMTYPPVDDLPEVATSTLLGVCTQLSQSRHAGLARWASSASDALLAGWCQRSPASTVGFTDTEPVPAVGTA